MRRLFLGALLWGLVAAGQAAAEPVATQLQSGVLQVSSEFQAGTREVGTGVVVSVPAKHPGDSDHTFLLTCAHLSTGMNPEIAGKALADISLGRRTDNFRDLDIIELDPKKIPAQPLATYQPEDPEDSVSQPDSFVVNFVGTTAAKYKERFSGGVFVVNPTALEAWKKSASRPALPATAEEDNTPFVLHPSWASGDAEGSWPGRDKITGYNFDPDQPDPGRTLIFDPTTRTVSAPARLAPGMSCAPLISYQEMDVEKPSPQILAGLGTEFRARMTGSTFTSPYLWEDGIQAYLQGDLREDIPATWQSLNGLQYLKIGKDSAEIIPNREVAGNLVLTPAGNGVTVPPGNGVTVPPGNGVTVPPGNGVTVPPGNGVTVPPGNGVTVPPGMAEGSEAKASCDPHALDAKDPWQNYGLKPGILWHGRESLGFSMDFNAKNPIWSKTFTQGPVLIYPDRSGIEFFLQNKSFAKHAQSVPAGAPVLGWLDQRYRTTKPSYQMISVDKSGLKPATLQRRPHGLKIHVYGPPPEDDPLEIDLNEYGALADRKYPEDLQLKTLVEVKSQKGDVYLVDLTDLFFQQTSELWPQEFSGYLGNSLYRREDAESFRPGSIYSAGYRKSQLNDLFGPTPDRERHVGISVRKKCSTQEVRINFPEPDEELGPKGPCTSTEQTFIHGLENIRELQNKLGPNYDTYDVGLGHFVPSQH